jgi:hypothetical protein
MNILEAILAAQGGNQVRQLGARVGVDENQAQTALTALLPVLAGAVTRNAQQPGGLESLLGALGDGHHQRYLDDASAIDDTATLQDGNAILGHLLGGKEVSRELASRVSGQTGIGSEVLKKMLPLVAAMMMGGLSKGALGGGRQQGGAGGGLGGLGDLLGGARGGAAGGLGSVLGGMLGGGAAAGFGAGQGGQAGQGGGLLDMLTPMLDRNGDGSAVDDILGMASQFLTRR